MNLRSEQKKSVTVVACREKEAVLFDASIKQKYDYALFPGMCGCVGLIICDNEQPDKLAIIHYVGGTNPESVLSFISNNFLNKNITITTFGGNSPREYHANASKDIQISPESNTIKTVTIPDFDKITNGFVDMFSDRNYYLIAIRNRYEINFILKSLSDNEWNLTHAHNNTVSYRNDVFLNLNDMTLSTNMNVNVIRDDYTPEEERNPFFNPNYVVRNTLWGIFHDTVINGNRNIVVTDKRSWQQYAKDNICKLSQNKNALFYCSVGLTTVIFAATKTYYANNSNSL